VNDLILQKQNPLKICFIIFYDDAELEKETSNLSKLSVIGSYCSLSISYMCLLLVVNCENQKIIVIIISKSSSIKNLISVLD
jgi:hypothetical protein